MTHLPQLIPGKRQRRRKSQRASFINQWLPWLLMGLLGLVIVGVKLFG